MATDRTDQLADRLFSAISKWNQVTVPFEDSSASAAVLAIPQSDLGSRTASSQLRKRLPFLSEIHEKARKRRRILTPDRKSTGSFQCQPWNRKLFQLRVSSFSVSNWFGKPVCIGPLSCARYGWVCDGPDQLLCKSCHARLCFKMCDDLEPAAFNGAVKQLLNKLTETGHDHLCPWRGNPSPGSFAALPSLPETLRNNYNARLTTLKRAAALSSCPKGLPRVDSSATAALLSVTQKIHADYNNDDAGTDRTDAEILALFGWRHVRLEATGLLLGCSLCHRHVGAWLFQQNGAKQASASTINVATDDNEARQSESTPGLVRQGRAAAVLSEDTAVQLAGRMVPHTGIEARTLAEQEACACLVADERVTDAASNGSNAMAAGNGSPLVGSSDGHAMDATSTLPAFDPREEHRWWCPWVCGGASGARLQDASMVGWASCVAAVAGRPSVRGSDSKQSLERVKRLKHLLSRTV